MEMGEVEQRDKRGTLGHATLTDGAARATPSPGKETHTAHALPRTTGEAGARGPEAAPHQAPADVILPGQSPRQSASPKTQAASVQHYSDMLAVVLAARDLTDQAQPEDQAAHAQILSLLAPLETRLYELNDHRRRLAQFGAGNIAGQATLDMAETAIRTWRQRLMLGTIVRTDELVLRFRSGAEVLRFLTGENADAPTLRGFDHASRVVGVGAAVPVLAPALVALAAEEAALLAFAGRMAARRVVLWALSNPAAALAASEALLGFGVQIGEDGWERFWDQLQDPQGRWFVIAQVLMDFMHVKTSLGPKGSGPEPTPDVNGARRQVGKARAVVQRVGDAAASTEPAAPAAHDPPAPRGRTTADDHAQSTETAAAGHKRDEGAKQPVQPPDADADGGPASWVDENAHMSPGARDYQDSAHGARSNRVSKSPQAPELVYRAADGSIQKVRFDGVEGRQMIDRKKAVTTFPKSERQAQRQSEALNQNGLTAVWEVPTASEATRATRLLSKLNITNITVRVVNP